MKKIAPQDPVARPRLRGEQRVLGAHQSIAGGLVKAVDRAVQTGCQCLQIFTRNINRWDVAPLAPDVATAFKKAVAAAGLKLVVVHDSYLINPASADSNLRNKSIAALVTECTRAELLGIPWVVAHPGAAGKQPPLIAAKRAAAGIALALKQPRGLGVVILIETTAGQGTCLGASFAEIATMLEQIDAVPGLSQRIGVCLDTCHVFAAGYGLSTKKELAETMDEFDRLIGFKRLMVIHANDSKRERGSRVDRHEAIGQGAIGLKAFGLFMNHPAVAKIPMILETPKEGADGKVSPAKDRRNLTVLRGLIARR